MDIGHIVLYIVLILLGLGLTAFCWARLAQRLGYDEPWVLGILMLIPVVNVLVFLTLAITESPNEKKLRELQSPEESPLDADDDAAAEPPAEFLAAEAEGYAEPTEAPEALIPQLIEILREGEPTPCRKAIAQLVEIGEPALPALEAALEEGDPDLAVDVTRTMRLIRGESPYG